MQRFWVPWDNLVMKIWEIGAFAGRFCFDPAFFKMVRDVIRINLPIRFSELIWGLEVWWVWISWDPDLNLPFGFCKKMSWDSNRSVGDNLLFPIDMFRGCFLFFSKNYDSRFSPSLIVYYLQIFRTKNPMGCLSMATPGCSIARWKSYIEMDLEGRTTGMTHLHWIAITINNDNYLNFDSCLHQHFIGIWTARQWWETSGHDIFLGSADFIGRKWCRSYAVVEVLYIFIYIYTDLTLYIYIYILVLEF